MRLRPGRPSILWVPLFLAVLGTAQGAEAPVPAVATVRQVPPGPTVLPAGSAGGPASPAVRSRPRFEVEATVVPLVDGKPDPEAMTTVATLGVQGFAIISTQALGQALVIVQQRAATGPAAPGEALRDFHVPAGCSPQQSAAIRQAAEQEARRQPEPAQRTGAPWPGPVNPTAAPGTGAPRPASPAPAIPGAPPAAPPAPAPASP